MNVFRRLRRLPALCYLIPIAYILQPLFWTPLEYRLYNYFHAKRKVDPWTRVIVVGIDRATRQNVFRAPVYPLSRHVAEHATLTRQLTEAGAEAIVFDLHLQEGVFREPPVTLAEAFRQANNVFLVMSMFEERVITPDGETVAFRPELPDSTLLAASKGAYLAQISVDADGTLRRFTRDRRMDPLRLETIPERLAGVRVAADVPIVFPSVDRPVPTVSYRDVLHGESKALAAVRDRIVFVGCVEDQSTDFVSVPRLQMLKGGHRDWGLAGVTTLAVLTETLLRGAPIRDVGWLATVLWNVLWCTLLLLMPPVRKPRLAFLIVCCIGLLALFVTGIVSIHFNRIFPAGLLFGCLLICGLHVIIAAHLKTSKTLHAKEVEHERVRREMETARQTQERFLPKRLPPLEGIAFWGINLSSREVSGDYYDVIDLGVDAPVVFAIGDVSGKGLAAALMMSSVQAGLHICLRQKGSEIGTIASDLNHLVWENTDAEGFVTFFLAELDKETRILRFVRAGHNIPFVLSADGKVRKLEKGELFFGMVPDLSYPVGTIQLELGDVICLYTDGTIDACNDEDEEFGLARLIEVVRSNREKSAQEIGESILLGVEAFSNKVAYADDITLIVVHL